MSDTAQQLVALLIVLGALAYLVVRLGGFGRKRRPKSAPVQLGSRLERGLKQAKKR
jgi:hypothetical protein